MRIELSNEEFDRLVELVTLGERMVNSGKDKPTDKYNAILTRVFITYSVRNPHLVMSAQGPFLDYWLDYFGEQLEAIIREHDDSNLNTGFPLYLASKIYPVLEIGTKEQKIDSLAAKYAVQDILEEEFEKNGFGCIKIDIKGFDTKKEMLTKSYRDFFKRTEPQAVAYVRELKAREEARKAIMIVTK